MRFAAIAQSKVLYNVFAALERDAGKWDSLVEAERRIIRAKLLEMKHAGVALPTEEQKAFNELQVEAAALSTTFRNNVLDSTKSFSLLLTDAADVAGLPRGSLIMLAQQAQKKREKEGAATAEGPPDASTGPWLVTLDHPSCEFFVHYGLLELQCKHACCTCCNRNTGESIHCCCRWWWDTCWH